MCQIVGASKPSCPNFEYFLVTLCHSRHRETKGAKDKAEISPF